MSRQKNHTSNKGITLIALIITIIVMIILVAVTLLIALGDNGIITNAKRAARESEQQEIYEKIVGSIVFSGDGSIDVKATYFAAKNILEAEDKPVTPISPSTESEITSDNSATIQVKGKYGTYTYIITPTEITIDDSESVVEEDYGDFQLKVGIKKSAIGNTATLEIMPWFSEDESAVIITADDETYEGYEISGFEDWMVAMAEVGLGIEGTYDEVVDVMEGQFGADLSTHEKVFDFVMQMSGQSYESIQEWALDIYNPTERYLFIDGVEVTTDDGVTWNKSKATYVVERNSKYLVELQLDEKIGRKTVKFENTSNLGTIRDYLIGKDYYFMTNGFTDDPNTQIDESKIEPFDYNDGFEEYNGLLRFENEIYAIKMGLQDSALIVTEVDLIYEQKGYEGETVSFNYNGIDTSEWMVLYDNTDENGTVEIVSLNTIGEITLGPSNLTAIEKGWDITSDGKVEDIDRAIFSYNNAINLLNDYADSLVTNSNKIGKARSVGSKPENPYYENSSPLISNYFLYSGGYPVESGDENSIADMLRMGCFEIQDSLDGKQYFLASRFSGGSEVGIGSSNVVLKYTTSTFYTTFDYTYGVRPVVTISESTLKDLMNK